MTACINAFLFLEKIKWNNTPDDYKLYRGEWLEVDCRVKNYPINVTARLGQNNLFDVRVADGRKLKREGNVFNLTNITSSDIGNYYCEVCNQKILMRELDIIRGTLNLTLCSLNQ